MLRPDLRATCEGAHLVLRLRDGVEHSRFPVADLDPIEELAMIEAGIPLPVRMWGVGDLDAALARQGWARTGPWGIDSDGRSTARVSTREE